MDRQTLSLTVLFLVALSSTGTFADKTTLPPCSDSPVRVDLPMLKSIQYAYPNTNSTYGKNLHCNWLISTKEPGYKLRFRLADVFVICGGDSLTLYDGPDNSSKVLRDKTCVDVAGATFPLEATTGNSLLLSLQSDDTTSGDEKGFIIEVIAGEDISYKDKSCSSTGKVLQASTSVQYITSPNFPGKYDSDQVCNWNITSVASSPNISIQILYMDLDEYNSKCYGRIYVFKGTPKEMEYCGGVYFYTFQFYTNENNIPIQFSSKNAVEKTGFVMSFKLIEAVGEQTSAPPTISTKETNKMDNDEKGNMQIIIVIVVVSVSVILIIVVVVIICARRRRQLQNGQREVHYKHETERLANA